MNGAQSSGRQAIVLILMPIFAMLGAVLMAPLLPTIQAHFADVPHADVLAPLLLTTPSLCLALLSPLAGILGDRFGPRRVLLWSLALYGIAGTAPMYLPSLYSILASRLLVGAAEAGLVTAAATLLAHYYSARDRQKWFAYQNVLLPLLGALIIASTGAIGDLNWRTTFAVYALSLLMLAAAAATLVEVDRRELRAAVFRFPPGGALVRIVAIAVPGSIAFYLAPVEVAYLLQAHGFPAPSTAAAVTAIGLVAGPPCALVSRKLTHLSVGTVVSIGMTMMGVGLVVMAIGQNVPTIAAGMVLQQAGGALMMTTGLTYVVSLAGAEERGIYSGTWFFFYMLAQFATPLLMSVLLGVTGDRILSVIVAGVLIVATCSWLLLASGYRRAVVVADGAAAAH